jgi:two-component system LytT family response regulator
VIRTLIVDDEPLARARISDLLLHWDRIEVVGECEDGADAVSMILEQRPDLLFLDVQMPELDGFDVLAAVAGEHLPAVIFVTAYDEFAIRAFEVHALDYLLKPVHADRFGVAVERALASMQQTDSTVSGLVASIAADRPDRLIARSGSRWMRLSLEDVEWAKAAGNYLRLGTARGECLVRGTIKWFLHRADGDRFLQVHRSIVVRVDGVAALEAHGNGCYGILMQSGFTCRSSRTHGASVRRLKNR